ncbi:hypothetical protein LINPERPRIM_LOCUS28619 [Linum perenne]
MYRRHKYVCVFNTFESKTPHEGSFIVATIGRKRRWIAGSLNGLMRVVIEKTKPPSLHSRLRTKNFGELEHSLMLIHAKTERLKKKKRVVEDQLVAIRD